MSNKVIELGEVQDQRCRTIEAIAIGKDISFEEAEKLHDNDLRTRIIGRLAIETHRTYAVAERMHENLVTYTKNLIEIDRINKENNSLGICAEECETYTLED